MIRLVEGCSASWFGLDLVAATKEKSSDMTALSAQRLKLQKEVFDVTEEQLVSSATSN